MSEVKKVEARSDEVVPDHWYFDETFLVDGPGTYYIVPEELVETFKMWKHSEDGWLPDPIPGSYEMDMYEKNAELFQRCRAEWELPIPPPKEEDDLPGYVNQDSDFGDKKWPRPACVDRADGLPI